MKKGLLPSEPDQRKLWLWLRETARKQIKGSVICKHLELQPPAKPSGSESRAAAQQPLPMCGATSPPCVAPLQPKTMPFTCGGTISAKLADAICTHSESPQFGQGARAVLLQWVSRIRLVTARYFQKGYFLGCYTKAFEIKSQKTQCAALAGRL